MEAIQRTYLPAAGKDWALPLYDPLAKLLGIGRVRRIFLDQAALPAAHRVLDLGCGTGTLALLIKRLHPGIQIVGLDPDPRALARARRKAAGAAADIRFDQGYADNLPYPDASFDRVFSSFMFHHVSPDQRENTLREARRVLAPGASLHMVDFAPSEGETHGWRSHFVDSSPVLKDKAERRVLALMGHAGFTDAKKVKSGTILLGLLRILYYQASVPGS
jgi:ubiquinone/menaquinone biosynthesis C-methylase UbiE